MTSTTGTFDEALLTPRRAWTCLALFALCFAVYFAIAFLLPHDRYIRYQQFTDSDLFRTRWVYERIHFDKTPIDVAIIGSSRVEAAISAPILEKELSEKFGRTIHVANLAVPQEGRNLHYLIARELIENHPETKMILVSVVEEADLSHPAFRYFADPGDLVRAPLLVSHYYFPDAAFLPYRQLSYFMQTLFPPWFGVSRSFRSDYAGTNFDTTYSFHLPSGKLVDRYYIQPKEKLDAESQQRIQELGGSWHPPSAWQAANAPLEREYTKRLVSVAKEHCVETVFVRLPFYNSPAHIYDEAFYSGLSPLLDAEQLSGDPHNFQDMGHFNRYGTDLVTPWLKEAISPYLAPLQDPASCYLGKH